MNETEYQAYTTGFENQIAPIKAMNPKEATLKHFKDNMYLAPIVVRNGRRSEQMFLWKELSTAGALLSARFHAGWWRQLRVGRDFPTHQ